LGQCKVHHLSVPFALLGDGFASAGMTGQMKSQLLRAKVWMRQDDDLVRSLNDSCAALIRYDEWLDSNS
jgi:hypothetical protein